MVTVKVKDGTPQGSASLCVTCRYVHIVRGFVSPNGLVPFSVRECTDYNDRRVPGAPAEANATGRRFGFVTTLSLQDKDENS